MKKEDMFLTRLDEDQGSIALAIEHYYEFMRLLSASILKLYDVAFKISSSLKALKLIGELTGIQIPENILKDKRRELRMTETGILDACRLLASLGQGLTELRNSQEIITKAAKKLGALEDGYEIDPSRTLFATTGRYRVCEFVVALITHMIEYEAEHPEDKPEASTFAMTHINKDAPIQDEIARALKAAIELDKDEEDDTPRRTH